MPHQVRPGLVDRIYPLHEIDNIHHILSTSVAVPTVRTTSIYRSNDIATISGILLKRPIEAIHEGVLIPTRAM